MNKIVYLFAIGICAVHAQMPNFELFNKSQGPVTLTISCGHIEFTTYPVAPQEKLRESDNIDPTKEITITIDDAYIKQQLIFKIKPRSQKQATTYVTWNPFKAPFLYPQTGPYYGVLQKTESGLPLKNNLKRSDIIRMK